MHGVRLLKSRYHQTLYLRTLTETIDTGDVTIHVSSMIGLARTVLFSKGTGTDLIPLMVQELAVFILYRLCYRSLNIFILSEKKNLFESL